MAYRDESSLQRAMSRFREAIEIDDEYGSAYVQLARAMVLLPTYAEFVLPGDCWYDEHEEDPIDCYEGAIRLIERNRLKAPYIDPYVNGIEGYVATKQRRWFEADGWFKLAQTETPRDADMWQWLSQFHASVGDMERALEAIEEANGLDSESGVNRERKGVLLMWQHPDANNLEAESWFDRASELDHNHYEAAWLVLNIRLGNWDEVTRSLQNHARATNDDAPWIDIFVAALMETSDQARVDAAITAIEPAIDARQLHGQYEYGAWVFLEQPARAIDAALDLIDARPEDMDVEFLFSPETKFMRQHARIGDIVDKLGLRRYWNEDPDNCPPLFMQQGERNWCESA